jgi:hypothetical protein
MTASKSPPLKVIGFYSLSADWTAYARFLRQEVDSRDPAHLSEESKEMFRRFGRGDELQPLSEENRQALEEQIRYCTDDLAMFEVLVTSPDATFDVGEFIQQDPSRPQSTWQIAWNETFLTSDGETVIGVYPCKSPDAPQYRVVFSIHFWKPDLPLHSSYGELALPPMQPLPERLWRLTPYKVPD